MKGSINYHINQAITPLHIKRTGIVGFGNNCVDSTYIYYIHRKIGVCALLVIVKCDLKQKF